VGAAVTRTSSFTSSPAAVFDAVYKALASIATVQQVDPAGHYAAGAIGWSMRSWGERIQIWVQPAPPGTLLTVESRCKVWTQVIDWGRNGSNVDRLLKTVKELLPAG
jgi:hypothetical protein